MARSESTLLVQHDVTARLSDRVKKAFEQSNTFTIRQQHSEPSVCFACPPCAFNPASYIVYRQDSEEALIRVQERSRKWDSYFCGPYHPLILEFREASYDERIIPFDYKQTAKTLNTEQKPEDVFLSIVRDDGMTCDLLSCKCTDSFALCNICLDSATVYDGAVTGDGIEGIDTYPQKLETEHRHRICELNQVSYLSSIPYCHSYFSSVCCFSPVYAVQLPHNDAAAATPPIAFISSACCFGNYHFLEPGFRYLLAPDYKFQDNVGAFVETGSKFFGPSVYSVSFDHSDESLSVQEKINILSGQLLANYKYHVMYSSIQSFVCCAMKEGNDWRHKAFPCYCCCNQGCFIECCGKALTLFKMDSIAFLVCAILSIISYPLYYGWKKMSKAPKAEV